MEVFPAVNETPGNLLRIALGAQAGDERVHDLHVVGDATIDGTVRITGNLILGTTSIVDVDQSTIYTFGDPVINLNTSFTGTYVPEAGLDIFRGPGMDDARIVFTESPDRLTVGWRIGLGADILRVARIGEALQGRRAMYWDVATLAIASNPSIDIEDAYVLQTIPSIQNLSASPGPITRIIADPTITSDVRWYAAAGDVGTETVSDFIRTSFENLTYGGTVWPHRVGTVSALSAMYFRVTTPTAGVPDARLRYVFDGVASLGVGADTAALLRTDTAILRLSGATTTDLAIADVSRVTLTDTLLDVKVPTDFGANLVTADKVELTEVDTELVTYHVPIGTRLLPPVPGWTPTVGTVTYDGITSAVTAKQALGVWEYHVVLEYTLVAPPDEPGQLLVPIYLKGGIANLRGMMGMHRKVGPPMIAYPINPGDMQVQDPFDVDVNLTAAACAGYSYLIVNIRKRDGTWQADITMSLGV